MATITSIVSLNQLVEWFESFADRHYFLKDFGFGEPYDIGTTRQMEFPYMWLTLDDTSIIATGTNVKSAIPDYSFRVFFMDKINIQKSSFRLQLNNSSPGRKFQFMGMVPTSGNGFMLKNTVKEFKQ